MKKRKFGMRAMCLALVASMIVPALAADDTAAQPLTRAEAAQQAAQAVTAISGAQSVQYAVWENGAITLTGAAGSFDRTQEGGVTDSTLYGIGSISKMYTTAAVMKLVEEGKIKLDEPVKTYLPDFTMADERYTKITVRMLLNHSSGLMGDSVVGSVLFDENYNAKEDLLVQLKTSRLKSDPGAFGVYCNDGFTLAELVVEAVAGKSFADYVQSTILTPAGLNDTYFPSESLDTSRLAKTYASAQDNRALPTETLSIVGAGGLYATASDVAKFGALFMGGNAILTDASYKATMEKEYAKGMWPKNSTNDALAYGLGWDTVHMYPFVQSNVIALSKGGDTLRCHASLIVLPEQNMTVAVLSSGGASTYNQLAGARILIDALAEKNIAITETAQLPAAEKGTMPSDIKAFAGVYVSSTAIATISFEKENTMTFTLPALFGGGVEEYAYYSDGTFRNEGNTYLMRFENESNGETYIYQMGYGQLEGLTAIGTANYAMQRLKPNEVSEQVANVWKARGASSYFMLNERYSAQTYLTSAVMAFGYVEETPGYAAGAIKIVDENNAQYTLEIPGAGSRSGSDIKVFEKDGKEYMQAGAYLLINGKDVPNIYAGKSAVCTILEDGYARWYKAGEDVQGKTMTVTVPKQASFHVYDAVGKVVASSKAWGDTTVQVPEGGCMVFAGKAGVRFQISIEDTLSAAA